LQPLNFLKPFEVLYNDKPIFCEKLVSLTSFRIGSDESQLLVGCCIILINLQLVQPSLSKDCKAF
jgi:hypothetical protein